MQVVMLYLSCINKYTIIDYMKMEILIYMYSFDAWLLKFEISFSIFQIQF